MLTTTKKVITNSRVKGNHQPQEFKFETIKRKIFPESFSAYPVSGNFYKAVV